MLQTSSARSQSCSVRSQARPVYVPPSLTLKIQHCTYTVYVHYSVPVLLTERHKPVGFSSGRTLCFMCGRTLVCGSCTLILAFTGSALSGGKCVGVENSGATVSSEIVCCACLEMGEH